MFVRGIGRTKFGELKQGLPELLEEASAKALTNAGMKANEVDACIVSNFLGGILQNQGHLNSVFASVFPGFDKPCLRVESACASGGAALFAACKMADSFDSVLVVGAEKMTSSDAASVTTALASASGENEQRNGLIFPAAYALMASSYFEEYGATIHDLSRVALKNHANANLNPLAHFYDKKISLDEIEASKIVCSPLRLMDCSAFSDGAAAAVISKKQSQNARSDCVEILACEMAIQPIELTARPKLTRSPATEKASERAFAAANIGRDKVRVAEVHDCFTINELLSLEALGLCEPGEAAKTDTRIGSRLAVNTDGGLKADGHPLGATGIAQLCEVVTQLRGTAGARQVKNADVGLAHSVGGSGGSAVVTLLKKT